MPRSDRLLDLIQTLRDGRLHRAADLAREHGVSARTIWRDMETLAASGLPVEGERGVGYLLRAPVTLPPMVLSMAELQALRAGLSHVAAAPDAGLARAARSLAARIASVIPAAAFPADEEVFVFAGEPVPRPAAHLPILRRAIRGRRLLRLTLLDPAAGEAVETVAPLGLRTEGQYRVLLARRWPDGDPGRFRLDLILDVAETGDGFPRARPAR